MITSVGVSAASPSQLLSKSVAQDSTSSLAESLAGMLQEFLQRASQGSRLEFSIETVQGQNPGTRQFVVTVKDPGTSSSSVDLKPTTSTRAPVDTPKISTVMGTAPAAPADRSAPLSDTAGPRLASGKLVTNEYEAYWAAQPAAVQELMNLPESQRGNKARELADVGYQIDVPIMLWGWDPLSTMTVRKNQGFTWVPSAKMDPVAVGPGLTFPGLPSYDPDHPPVGSIKVSTDWAKGFEHTSPWMRFEEIS